MKFSFTIGSRSKPGANLGGNSMGPKTSNKQFYLFMGIATYILFVFFGIHLASVSYNNGNIDLFSAINTALSNMISRPFSFTIYGKTLSTIGTITLLYAFAIFYVWVDSQRNAHNMPGKEKGSAKWMTNFDKYNKVYTDPPGSPKHNGKNNMILTQNVFLNMDTRQTLRNNNVLVVGGSGAGKSRYVVKPNLLQMNCSYVVTDPSGELLHSVGGALEKNGYEIKVFNLVEMSKSDQYNPFQYIRNDEGVLMMINCLIKNTNEGKSGGDPFWEKSETALLQALCFYLTKYCSVHQRNFTSVMKLLRAAEIDENNPAMKSMLDRLFEQIAQTDPNSIAYKQYLTFKMGAGKTLKSILISCSVRLTVFNLKQIENLTKVDTLNLTDIGERKQALFVVIPTADSTYNFLVSMMYSQLFESLYFKAETEHQDRGGRLPVPVRFLLDEFVNIGQIPDFTKKLATMRKYDISCTVILQNLAQIKSMYKDDWESIVGNCDSFLFLGGQEQSTLEYISKELGRSTINVRNRSMSKGGKGGGASHSFNKDGRELLTPDELARIPTTDCVLMIRGLEPVYDKKYDYPKHPNYKLTGDFDESLAYVNTRDNNAEADTMPKTVEDEYKEERAKEAEKMKENVKNPMTDEDVQKLIEKSINVPENVKENKHVFGAPITPRKRENVEEKPKRLEPSDSSGLTEEEKRIEREYEEEKRRMEEEQKRSSDRRRPDMRYYDDGGYDDSEDDREKYRRNAYRRYREYERGDDDELDDYEPYQAVEDKRGKSSPSYSPSFSPVPLSETPNKHDFGDKLKNGVGTPSGMTQTSVEEYKKDNEGNKNKKKKSKSGKNEGKMKENEEKSKKNEGKIKEEKPKTTEETEESDDDDSGEVWEFKTF